MFNIVATPTLPLTSNVYWGSDLLIPTLASVIEPEKLFPVKVE